MKPVHQTLFRPSAGDGAGNCMSACIASLLELPLDAVPNFAAVGGTNGEWWQAMTDWLGERGLGIALIPFKAPHEYRDDFAWWLPHDAYVLLDGPSPRGDWGHTVVARVAVRDGETRFEVVHDPHPSGDGLGGDAQAIWMLVPRDPADAGRKLGARPPGP